jgi:hypothetical protein
MTTRQRQTEPKPELDPLAWLASVYRVVADDDPDDAGQWMTQLEAWLAEVRQRLREVRRECPRPAVGACEAGQE